MPRIHASIKPDGFIVTLPFRTTVELGARVCRLNEDGKVDAYYRDFVSHEVPHPSGMGAVMVTEAPSIVPSRKQATRYTKWSTAQHVCNQMLAYGHGRWVVMPA